MRRRQISSIGRKHLDRRYFSLYGNKFIDIWIKEMLISSIISTKIFKEKAF